MNILEIKKTNFCYKQQFVLNNFTLSIKEGSIYGLVGKPKSGKTTILKLILGLLRTSPSSIYFQGEDLHGCRTEIREIVGNIIDLPYYQNFLTVRENFKYLDMLYCYGDLRIMQMLQFIGLSSYADAKVRKLTRVQRQCLSIGMALYHKPKLLVFDDLLRDLDKNERMIVSNLLLKIKGLGKTILLSSRNSLELPSVCTHIGLLESGSIVKESLGRNFADANLAENIASRNYNQYIN